MSTNSDKSDLKSLLATYSLDEIVEMFSGIDEKIVALHQVSSEDFMNLNRDFREFHAEARQISDNASYLCQFVTGHENAEMVAGVEQLYQELRSNTDVLDGHIQVISEVLTRLLSRIRQSFFPIKNFRQNLTSLKFLETNYELTFPAEGQGDMPSLAVQEVSEQLKAQLNLIEVMLSKLKQRIRDYFNLKEQFNAERAHIDDILSLLKNEIESYSSHYKNIREHLPAIQSETQRSSENIASIVTNLQYQDIIKQKMEHIQQTHKELLDEIGEMDHGEADEESKANYFVRIRDIAGLQAAQLMHTNKEYQSAIQKISDKFLEIGQSMTRISTLCNKYLVSGKGHPQFMDRLKDNLEGVSKQLDSFYRFSEAFDDKRGEIHHVLNRLVEGHDKVNQYMGQLDNQMGKVLEGADGTSGQDTIAHQMRQLHGDLLNNQQLLSGIFEDYQLVTSELEDNTVRQLKGNQRATGNLPGKISSYLENIGQIEQQILDKLTENNEKSEKIYAEVQNSVNHIKYYDYFENVIGGIIEELNAVNYNLKLYSTPQGESKEENLRKLREYYTMNTEFMVHEQVSRGEAPEVDVGEEGGDLELF